MTACFLDIIEQFNLSMMSESPPHSTQKIKKSGLKIS